MKDFLSLGLPQPLLVALERLQFTTPTPVQAAAIPSILEGHDILANAQTGTGKTGAFGIPLVAKLMLNSRGSALVMTPTRELAVQVMSVLESLLGKHSAIKTAVLIGGESIQKQLQQLRARPRLIVGTPGRINDHLQRGSLMLHDTNFLVLDETDRMLDMGFTPQIEKIIKYLPQQRQTLLFSATLPKNIIAVSEKYLRNPVRVSIGATTAPVAKIKQEILHVSEEEKYGQLITQLNQRTGSVIVFVKTKWGAEKLAKKLRQEKHSSDALHGDLNYSKRQRVIAGFRRSDYRILVATDIAARGLDIPHVEHVINFDLPHPEEYIHRIGRTARAGAEGSAMSLITPADRSKWNAIHRLMNPGAKPDPREPRSQHKPGGRPKKPGGRPFRAGGNKKPRRGNARGPFNKQPSVA